MIWYSLPFALNVYELYISKFHCKEYEFLKGEWKKSYIERGFFKILGRKYSFKKTKIKNSTCD